VRRLVVACLLVPLLLGGCGNPDQKLVDAAAQAGREAESGVNTARLAIEQLEAGRLWRQPAAQLVDDAEKDVEKAGSSFSSQQPSTDASRRTYEQVNEALDNAAKAVTAVRIALGNDDLPTAVRQVDVLRRSGAELQRIGELTK
jgi:hypothetical protein